MRIQASLNVTIKPKPMFGRGWNLYTTYGRTLAEYTTLRATGANLIRFGVEVEADSAGGLQFRPGTLQEADNHIRFSAQCGMDLVLGVYLVPWPSRFSTFWTTPSQQSSLIQRWQELVVKWLPYRHVSFDILNEAQHDSWGPLAVRIIEAIRAVDPSRVIVYEPAPHASPWAFTSLTPLPFDGIVYSPHMYDPHSYTHQGVGDEPGPPPDFVPGAATAWLQPVVDFQKRYNVPIYVGEFGCARWAPHRVEYLAEVIDVCNAQGWGWCYHAWDDWEGWDSQCNSNPADKTRRVDEPTFQLVRSALQGIMY